ncbi:MAG: 1-(5-phosphoribosyl)-5-[(5-phosphoribosylamino)methylideneamino]imidazole-4-carboxamide isomerase [Planctomycetes bacterium]|nr:1-(5-phosphoribosyl)-5-[(5-phosphoribosylamino)methylideneamino]imidazole-4-carboxamide isomerase [Planctomycetota bacterium]
MSEFTVYPAIDLRNGNVVRLEKGERDKETVYRSNPDKVAESFEVQGVRWLHVVNLDGAFDGGSGPAAANMVLVGKICKSTTVSVQFGGGLRDEKSVDEALALGVSRVVLGTAAIKDPELIKRLAPRLGDKLAIGIDAKEGKVAVSGWTETSDVAVVELGKRMIDMGVKRFVYTDIGRDGMFAGPDVEGARALAKLGAPVICSGGVGKVAHLKACAAAAPDGVEGVIVGKAFYEGHFTVRDALNAVKPKT